MFLPVKFYLVHLPVSRLNPGEPEQSTFVSDPEWSESVLENCVCVCFFYASIKTLRFSRAHRDFRVRVFRSSGTCVRNFFWQDRKGTRLTTENRLRRFFDSCEIGNLIHSENSRTKTRNSKLSSTLRNSIIFF